MSEIEIGTRVKVTHKPKHDHEYGSGGQPARRANDGREGKVIGRSDAHGLCFEVDTQSGCCAWYEPDELTPVDDTRPGDGAHLHSIVESAQALNRGAVHWQREATEAKAAISGWVARCDALRIEAERGNAARVEAERGNAARVEAERRENEARADREALEARIQVAQVALDAVRLALEGCEDVAAVRIALDRLDRALRGVPAADRGRQGERFHAKPATIEACLAEVERLIGSMSDHLAALDQRVAGLGNGLDEVRDPAWFAARFREHMKRHGFASVDAASVAEIERDKEPEVRRKSNPFEVREPPPWVPVFLERFGARLTQGVDGLVPWVRADITLGTIEDAIGVLREHVGAYWTITAEQKPLCAYCPRPCIGTLSVCEEHSKR